MPLHPICIARACPATNSLWTILIVVEPCSKNHPERERLNKSAFCRNHETLNTHGRFTYATPEGMQDFAVWKILEDFTQKMKVTAADFSESRDLLPVTAEGMDHLQGKTYDRRCALPLVNALLELLLSNTLLEQQTGELQALLLIRRDRERLADS